jgi:hypothetical protein
MLLNHGMTLLSWRRVDWGMWIRDTKYSRTRIIWLNLAFRTAKTRQYQLFSRSFSSSYRPDSVFAYRRNRRKHGLRAPGETSTSQRVQICWCRPLSSVTIRPEAVLHQLCDQMLSHVDGAQLDHLDRLQLRRYQYLDTVVV